MQIDRKRLSFLWWLIRNIKEDLDIRFSDGPHCFRNASGFVRLNALSSLIQSIEAILLPVITAYIGEKKKVGIVSIYDKLFEGENSDILRRLEKFGSVALETVYRKCSSFRRHLFTVTDRVFSDWHELEIEFFLHPNSSLLKISLASGDEHADGSQTSVFLNSENKGFVYKPVDVAIDSMMHNMIASCERELGYLDYQALKVLKKKSGSFSYGYIEFCHYNGKVNTVSEVSSIYKSFGRLIAYGQAFKMVDGHCDNVIVNSPYVRWIDLETAFHTFSGDNIRDVHSIEQTGLLFEAKKTNVYIGIVTGLQGGVIPRLSLTFPHPYKDGTDDLYLRYFKVLPEYFHSNRVYLDDAICMPEDYIEDIQAGYKESYRYLCDQKEKFAIKFDSFLATNIVRSRHMFITTACYARYIGLLQHILGVKAGNILATIRNERKSLISKIEQPFEDFIIENEIIDMCNGVIPYFLRLSHKKSIMHSSGASRSEFFNTHLRDDIRSHLTSLKIGDLDRNMKFIKTALDSTSGISSWEEFVKKFNFQLFDCDNISQNINNEKLGIEVLK